MTPGTLIVVCLVLVLPALLPAMAIAPDALLAVFVAPLLTAASAALALVVGAIFDMQIWPLFVFLIALANTVAVRRLRKGAGHLRPAGPRWRYGFIVAAVAVVPLLVFNQPNLSWDAHAIWLFHARWVLRGGEYYRHSLTAPAFNLGHPDYPPLIPAIVGLIWKGSGGHSFRVAQVTITALNVSAVAVLGLGFLRLVPERMALAAAFAGAAICAASYVVADTYTTNGNADLLCASALAASAAYLLILPMDSRHLVIGMLAALVAALTKNDGMLLALTLVAFGAIRYRSSARRILPVAGAVAACVLSWVLLTRAVGVKTDQFEPSRLRDLVAGRIDLLGRSLHIASAVGPQVIAAVVLAAIAYFVGRSSYSSARLQFGIGAAWPVWILIVVQASLLGLVYLVTPYPLKWELSTTVGRATIVLQQLLLVQAACYALAWYACRDAWASNPARAVTREIS